MIPLATYRFHRTVIYGFVLLFEVVGLFGNINLVVLIVRKKSLRTKYGYILATLATLHTLCLLYELVDMAFSVAATFFAYEIHRDACFLALFPYIFFNSLQTGTMWVLALDLLITTLFPLRSRKFHLPSYLLYLFILPVIYGITTVISGFITLDKETLFICNPPIALSKAVRAQWYYIMTMFTVLTIVFYSLAFVLIYFKAHRPGSDIRYLDRKALKTLKYLIFLFVLLRCITVTITSTLIALDVDKDVADVVQSYNIIFGVTAYSQNAYVCYFRSYEYRMLLRDQISKIHPKLERFLPKLGEMSTSGQQGNRSTVVSVLTKTAKMKNSRKMKNKINNVN